MQRFRVVYRGISHESLVFSGIYMHTSLGECVYQENTSDEWDIPRLYDEKGLHNYFISDHRKCSGPMGRLGAIQLNCSDRWEGSVD